MACIAPPPPVIEITVLVKTTTPTVTATFSPTHPSSAPYLLNDSGELDFSCFKTPIRVTFHIADPSADRGIVFDAGYNGAGTPLTFLDDISSAKPKPSVLPGHHQFPGGPPPGGGTSFSFVYHNDWDGGDGSHTPRYVRSKYGLRFASRTSGYLGELDPIVDNGGNQN